MRQIKMKNLILGIDTSNYKTSVALVDEDGKVIFNFQELLKVKKNTRGLRQSDAFYQHANKLPKVIVEILKNHDLKDKIRAVSCSTKPRPIEDSYMPVFNSGAGIAKIVSASLNVPCFEFSHQEGHIEAVKFFSKFNNLERFICFHFSGGTSEAILVDENENGSYPAFRIIGGSKDISFGQVIDRIGVSLGLDFPCGAEMDKIILERNINLPTKQNPFTKVKVKDGYVNLSGMETQGQRIINKYSKEEIVFFTFQRIAQAMAEIIECLYLNYKINNFLFVGGVSCSLFIRDFLVEYFENNEMKSINLEFGKPELSSDNAVGIALLGGKKWR